MPGWVGGFLSRQVGGFFYRDAPEVLNTDHPYSTHKDFAFCVDRWAAAAEAVAFLPAGVASVAARYDAADSDATRRH